MISLWESLVLLTLASPEGLEVAVATIDAVIDGLIGKEAEVTIEKERETWADIKFNKYIVT